MNTSELMIGDWILDGKEYAQVTSIACGGVIETTKNNYCPEDVVQYIPLTLEILGKNGWTDHNEYRGYVNEEKNIAFYFNPQGQIKLKVRSVFSWLETMNLKNIFYVHELQHALRLCGLSDIANNLKIE